MRSPVARESRDVAKTSQIRRETRPLVSVMLDIRGDGKSALSAGARENRRG